MTRIEREKHVIAEMVRIYCRKHHQPSDKNICDECQTLLNYALARLDSCPHGNSKSSCRKCKIHCYVPAQRERIRTIMKYVGPRMIIYHPVDAIRHIISELK